MYQLKKLNAMQKGVFDIHRKLKLDTSEHGLL